MKTKVKIPFTFKETNTRPRREDLEFGILYYQPEFKGCVHLCPCGCDKEHYIPIAENLEDVPEAIRSHYWQLHNREPLHVTPSLAHWYDCKSHYVIHKGYAVILG